MLSLAVGVAVTTAVYSVIDAILLKDLGIPHQEQVFFVVTHVDDRLGARVVSQPDFLDLHRAQTSFKSLSASASFAPAVVTPTVIEILPAEAVEGTYFSTLGIIASVGRVIQPADETGRARVAVLSDALWRARFASDSKIVGQTIRISGDAFEVIGVAAASFDGLRDGPRRTRLWIPLAAYAPTTASKTPPRERRELTVVGRLTPSITAATAAAEVSAIAAGLDAAFPRDSITKQPGPSERSWRLKPVASNDPDDLPHRFGFTVIALVALVLVVACTNLGNLVLARGTMRQHEVAVRSALGASSWRLVREQLAESVLIATGGAVASYIVFQILCVLMAADFQVALPFGGRWTLSVQPSLNAPALATGAVALLISLGVFGLEPALQLTRSRDIRGGLASGAGGVAAPRARRHRALLRWQVAISAGFFIIATMFVKYTIAEARHDSGIELERLGVAVLNLQTQQWDELRVRRTLERVIDEARRDPAIAAVSVSTGLPFGVPTMMRVTLSLPDKAILQKTDSAVAAAIVATPSLFRTLGVPILRGRGFDDRDHRSAPPVAVLSEFTARRIFGTTDVVGRPLSVQQSFSRAPDAISIATVIGVAGDTDVRQLFRGPGPLVYLPLTQRYDPFLTIAARTGGDAVLAVRAVRDAIRRADPDLAVDVSGTGREILAGAFVLLRAVGLAAVSLGALTLLLAMVGLFGIQSHMVAYRTREIGVRMSFGATASRIRAMVLKDGYRPVLEGLAIGLFIGLAGRAIVRVYLDVDVSVVDPWMLLVVPIPLILAAFCACYLPAHRAASVDPIVALRHV